MYKEKRILRKIRGKNLLEWEISTIFFERNKGKTILSSICLKILYGNQLEKTRLPITFMNSFLRQGISQERRRKQLSMRQGSSC